MDCQLIRRFLIQYFKTLIENFLMINTEICYNWSGGWANNLEGKKDLTCKGETTGKHNASRALLAWSGTSSVITMLQGEKGKKKRESTFTQT